MARPTNYEIEIRGRATDWVLRPVVDDFRIERTDVGTTLLTGQIRDPSHLNGLLAHFTSMNVEVVELRQTDSTATDVTAVHAVDPYPEKGTQP